jgi:hypothetical protein
VQDSAVWPDWLQSTLLSTNEPEPKVASPGSPDSTASPK